MDLELAGRVAIVTGATRGIGRAIAESLAHEGVNLAIVARNEVEVKSAAHDLAGGDVRVLPVAIDLGTPDAPAEVIDSTLGHFGRLDILINNVGASVGGDVESTSSENLRRSFLINVDVPFQLSKAALPHMRDREFGRIVMLASIYGREAGGKIPYNAAKAAETSLTKSLAREVAPWGITVNSVAPGSISYPGGSWARRVEADPEGMAAWVKRELPLGRFGTTEEVANVVAFLCSPRASLVNGASIVVDGSQGRSNL